MIKIVVYLDCGCAIFENGVRALCPTCAAASRLQLPTAQVEPLREQRTALTLKEIVSAALDEFAGAGGVSDQDIEMFLSKQGVAEVKLRLLAGQTVGEAYEEENHE